MKNRLRHMRRRLTRGRALASMLLALDSRAFRLGRSQPTYTTPESHTLIVAAPGDGNIGDTALLETLLQNSVSPVSVITQTKGSYPELLEVASFIARPDLWSINPVKRLAAMFWLGKFSRQIHNSYVIGADIMDGVYNGVASVTRFSIASQLGSAGVSSTITGFSWSDESTPGANKGLRRAARSSRLIVRDPVSHERLTLVGQSVELSADLVFMHQGISIPPQTREWVEERRSSGRKIAILNASALIGEAPQVLRGYAAAIRTLDAQGYSVIFLPHVKRRSGDDSGVLRVLRENSSADSVMVSELLTPSEVKGVSSLADVVITGRMHLGVLSLTQLVPCVALSTQGKVEGLARMFPGQLYCIDPVSENFEAEFLTAISRATASDVDRANLNNVEVLARRNLQS